MQTTLDGSIAKERRTVELQHSLVSEPSYSPKELAALRGFIEIVKDESQRKDLVCWGDHSDYSKGY